ncbi:hypothetical protein EFB08_16470 [Rufibacter latericius]|uniref:DUF998 domain-containing protein n=1 Tax=Rufibacter latericius TaxID=2487040 RepID=A0A3M9MHJ4_9BACT|nr:hypothetical protein EFB08_16470 [Rufibacter latericius]
MLKVIPVIALLGGFLLALHYVLHLVYGVQTGKILWEAMESPLGKADGSVFSAAFAIIDLALIFMIVAHLKSLKNLKYVALFFGVVAFLAASTGFCVFTFAGKMIPFLMPVACLSMFISAILLGITGILSKVFPAWVRYAMIGFGVFTAPLGWLLPKFVGAIPMYVLFELHFFPMGILWMCIGTAFYLKNRRSQLESTSRLEALYPKTALK